MTASAATGYDCGYAGGRAGTGSIIAHGIDISTWQDGNVDFTAVKNADYSYGILRAGHGGVNQIFALEKLNSGYTVNHYTQNIYGKASSKDTDNYTFDETENVGISPAGEMTVALKNYDNLVAPDAVTITPTADGSTVINYYYRLMYGDVNTDSAVDIADISVKVGD